MNQRPDNEKSDQRQRLSRALRENLKRRRAQAKGRQAPEGNVASGSHDSAEIHADKVPDER
jgi:hypothetical protein